MWRFTEFTDAQVRQFQTQGPFRHLVLDGFVDEGALPALLELVDAEPLHTYAAEIYTFDASAKVPTTAPFRALIDDFAANMAPALARLTGMPLGRADMRAYAYGPGHYLLPHTDHQDGQGRLLAYAFYLPSPLPPEGGELELFACTMGSDGEPTATRAHSRILPVQNRCVVFEVGPHSLHQVREVLAGSRISLAGWFYA
jgi:Rps23 Pro-64 3,4-dihydroxylase Tpa1-like proline 4-hydroxylase